MKCLPDKPGIRLVKFISVVIFIVYISYLIYLTFFSHLYGRNFVYRSINIIPLKTVIQFLTSSFYWKIVVTNIAGNIAAFMPMGFLLPIVFGKQLNVFSKVVLIVLAATVTIEAMQYITGAGATDIDDVILNLFGGILGYSAYKIILRIPVITPLFRNKKS